MNSKDFERLVEWISSCLHKEAIVTHNDKLIDRDTLKKRQIDVSIKFNNGLSEVLWIVEARKRSRRTGIDYIEQIKTKKESVNADIAIIVSSKGFDSTALTKAHKFGIRTFSLKEALENDWSQTIRQTKYIERSIAAENVVIFMIDKVTKNIINPHPDIIDKIKKEGESYLALHDTNGNPFKSMKDLYNLFITSGYDNLIEKLKSKKENAISLNIYFDLAFDPENKIYVYDALKKQIEINYIYITGNFWIEQKNLTPYIQKYKDENSDKIIAEIIDFPNAAMLIENPNNIDEDRVVHIHKKT